MNNLFKKVVSSVALVAMLAALIPTASFAATISEGDLVKAAGSSAIYLIQDGKKRVFPHSSVYLSWGYPANYSTVKTVTAEELAAYAEGDAVIYRDGFMFRFKGVGMTGGFDPSAVFFVSDGKIRPIESATAYMKLFNGGVNESAAWDRVYWIPDDLLAKFTYPQGSNITSAQIDAGQLPNGLVVRDSNSLYYVVNGGLLSNVSSTGLSANRYTANSNVFSKMLVTKLANSVLNLMPAGPVINSADTSLLTVKKLTPTPSATNVVLSSDKTSVEADGASYATLTATVPSTVTSVSFAITSGSGTLSASTVTPVAGVATVRVTPTAASVSGTLTVSASATGLTSASVTLTTVANTLAPQVVSVSNQGMRIINVIFDKAVDKTTAETVGNYSPKNNKATGITPSSAKLLADGKTVQLNLPAGFYNDSTEDSIEIKNVQNVAQTAPMSTITKLLTVTDTSVPTVVSVEALGSKAVRVTFSEAVQNVKKTATGTPTDDEEYLAFKLDDKTLEADTGLNGVASCTTTGCIPASITYEDAGDFTKALINFTSPISVGAHTLTVSYNGVITDYNVTTDGTANVNVMQPAGYVLTVVPDTSVPTLSSVEVLTQTKVRYTFSKPVDLNTTTDGATKFFWSTAANQNSGTFGQAAMTKVSDTVYEVTWGTAITAGTVYFYAGTAAVPVRDFSGNSISPVPSSKVATVSTDTAPAISSVSMDTDSDRVVVVYFNKDVEEASAETSSNYVFKSSTGTVLTATTGGNGIGSNGNPISAPVNDTVNNKKKVTITLGTSNQDSNALPGGTYQLTITGVKTLGGTTAMSSQTYTFTVTDKTRPTLYSTTNALADGTNYSASANRVVVKYSEPMGSSALSAVNYKIKDFDTNNDGDVTDTGETDWKKLSDISGVSLSFRNDNKDVVIDFPTDIDMVTTSTDLMIGYVDGSTTYAPTDTSGNLFKETGANNITLSGALTVSNTNLNIDDTPADAIAGGAHDAPITSITVTSATTLEAIFLREIDQISASEFTIRSKANATGVTPTSATIDSTNKKKVVFTIPSGITNEFTSSDVNTDVGIKLSGQNASLTADYVTNTTKDITGLGLSATDNDVAFYLGDEASCTFKNDIKPIMKSFVLEDSNTILVAFDGKIESNGSYTDEAAITSATIMNEQALANDLIITQTVGSTTTTITGNGFTAINTQTVAAGKMAVGTWVTAPDTDADSTKTSAYDLASDSTIVTIKLGTALSLTDPVILKTVSDDSIDAVGANGAKIAANTSGITNSSFVSMTNAEGLTGAGIAASDVIKVTFNKNVDKTTIIASGVWATTTTDYTANGLTADCSTGVTCYSQTITNGAIFNSTTDKITFSGANIGEFLVAAGITADATANLTVVYNETAKEMYLVFGAPSVATDVSAGEVEYTPSSSMQTTVGTAITTTFKPVMTVN